MKISLFAPALVLASATAVATPAYQLNPIGTYNSGIFDESAAEIVAYDKTTQRAFVVNANDVSVDVLDISNPADPQKIAAIDVTLAGPALGAANSVAVNGGLLAVAVESVPKQNDGLVAFYATDSLTLLGTVPAGALPDMLTFTPDGRYVVVANEGEPDDDYLVDPEGSITVIDLEKGVNKAKIKTADFSKFNKPSERSELEQAGVRIFGPNASVAQDLEPEYVGISANGETAYVALQENNALAVVDIKKASVEKIIALGTKDHAAAGNEFDASNEDGAINIQSWPVLGMYMPDAIATYTVNELKSNGKTKARTYIVTANEGDSRDYDGFSEETRIKDLEEDTGKMLDPAVFPNAADLVMEENLGRLKTTTTLGDANNDGLIEELYAYGARSFSIWDDKGQLVWDSGSDLETITANLIGADFNSTNDENGSFDNRSDDKGPEPEAVAIGEIDGRSYAFVGLERVGGIVMYDITDPTAPFFITYTNNRDFSVADVTTPAAGDLGPEGIQFIAAEDSPNGEPLIIVGNEVSGTTTLFAISPVL